MLPVAHHFATANFSPLPETNRDSANHEGKQIRFAVADLYRQGRLAEADQLTRAALQHYPDSEDVLIIRALICEALHAWHAAATALEHLLRLQGQHAPVETCCQQVRVLRCDGQLNAAMQAALRGLVLHPAHPALASELAQLEAMGAGIQAKVA